MSDGQEARIVRTKETRTAIWELRDDGIVVQRIRSGIQQSVADARENIVALREIAGGTKRALLADGRGEMKTDAGVREVYGEKESLSLVFAAAMLTTSVSGRILFNFFITMMAPKIPTRMFTDEVEAIRWLKKMVELNARARSTG